MKTLVSASQEDRGQNDHTQAPNHEHRAPPCPFPAELDKMGNSRKSKEENESNARALPWGIVIRGRPMGECMAPIEYAHGLLVAHVDRGVFKNWPAKIRIDELDSRRKSKSKTRGVN